MEMKNDLHLPLLQKKFNYAIRKQNHEGSLFNVYYFLSLKFQIVSFLSFHAQLIFLLFIASPARFFFIAEKTIKTTFLISVRKLFNSWCLVRLNMQAPGDAEEIIRWWIWITWYQWIGTNAWLFYFEHWSYDVNRDIYKSCVMKESLNKRGKEKGQFYIHWYSINIYIW